MVDVLELAIAKLTLRPGDLLVVKINHTLEAALADKVGTQIKDHLPNGVRVLLIDNSIELSVLTQADIKARI